MDKRTKKTVANIFIIAFCVCGLGWVTSAFFHFGGEYTNNAQVRQNIVPIASRVQGFIKEIRFEEFQQVAKGDTLVIIDDAEYKLRLAQARADYQNAIVGKDAMGTAISTISNNVAINDAAIDEVEILLANAESDYNRFKVLYENNAVTKQQYEGIATKYESLKAKLQTMKLQKKSASLAKNEQVQRLEQTQARIDVCKAALELAELNLSYCTVTAPCNGIMSRKGIQAGELIMPGKPLFSVVDNSSAWIVANFRETQLGEISVGDEVEIEVDAYPGVDFNGVVESISNATGAQYSYAAPDNSQGNFVKVEQRIPVKILFTGENPEQVKHLSAGMNAEVKVK